MLDAGAEVSVVLPYDKEEFIRDSVDYLPGSNWRARFERVMERATQCVTASTQKLELGGVSYDFANELLLGLSAIHAHRLETALIPVAAWDGVSGDGPGGTASAVENWRALGYNPEIVQLAKLLEGHARRRLPNHAPTTHHRTSPPDWRRRRPSSNSLPELSPSFSRTRSASAN